MLNFHSSEFEAAVEAAVAEQMKNLKVPEYNTSSFFTRSFGDHERLADHKNFEVRKNMVNLDLRAFNFLQYIEAELVKDIEPIG